MQILGTCRLRPQQGLGALESREHLTSPPPVAKVTRRPLIAQEDMRLWAPHGVFSVQPAKVLSFFLTWFPWFLVSLLCCLLKKKTRRLMS